MCVSGTVVMIFFICRFLARWCFVCLCHHISGE